MIRYNTKNKYMLLNSNREFGITLIALVITIIVLLILAGVTLNMVIGNNGIFKKANSASDETKYKTAYEEVKLKVLEAQVKNNGKATLSNVIELLEEDHQYIYIIKYPQTADLATNGDIIKTDKMDVEEVNKKEAILVIHNGYEFKINKDLTIEEGTKTGEVAETRYRIKYDLQGGNGEFAEQVGEKGEKITIYSEEPSKDENNFKGWATTADGEVKYNAGQEITLNNDNITLYAVWEIKTYKVTYDLQGGSGDFPVQTLKSGEEISSKTPTRSGYEFKGWSTTAGGTVQYNPGSAVNLNNDITIYAVWKIKQQYFLNGGDLCNSVTGGWTASKSCSQSYCTVNTTNATMSLGDAGDYATVATVNKVDLTNYNKIYFTYNINNNYNSAKLCDYYFGISTDRGNNSSFVRNVSIMDEGYGTKYLDVSDIKGSYYIKIYTKHNNNSPWYNFYSTTTPIYAIE